MKQVDRELLLRDLCSRLPYGVKVVLNGPYCICEPIKCIDEKGLINNDYDIDEIKPYLFPLSSMTEEQRKEQEAHFICIKHDMPFSICRYMEWCYKNHLDVNGLIPKELALDATGLDIY